MSFPGTPMNQPRKYLYLPLWLWCGFSLSTIACFQSGLFTYFFSLTTAHYVALYIYLAAVHLAFVVGYRRGIARRLLYRQANPDIVRHAWITLLGVTAYCVATVGISQITGLTASRGLKDLNEARDTAIVVYGSSAWNHLLAVLSVFLVPMVGIIFGYWRHLSRVLRFWGIALVGYIVLTGVGGGNRSGAYALASILSIALLAALCSGRLKLRLIVAAPIVASSFLLFVVYSNLVIYDRYHLERGTNYVEWAQQVEEIRTSLRFDHALLKYIPASVAPSAIQGLFYFSHGYNNLAYSLLKRHEGFGYGFGHASFLVRNLAKLVGDDALLLSKPYRMQLEDGVPGTAWFTAYMWIASDTTYIGSIVVFYFVGMLLASVWKTVLASYNFWAVTLLLWLWAGLLLVHNTFIATDYAAWVGYFGSLFMFLHYGGLKTWSDQSGPGSPARRSGLASPRGIFPWTRWRGSRVSGIPAQNSRRER